MNECQMCWELGKTWEGDDPKCAFASGAFSSDNWNCATMNALRDLAEQASSRSDEERCGVVPLHDGSFIVLGWYKSRGRPLHSCYVAWRRVSPRFAAVARPFVGFLVGLVTGPFGALLYLLSLPSRRKFRQCYGCGGYVPRMAKGCRCGMVPVVADR